MWFELISRSLNLGRRGGSSGRDPTSLLALKSRNCRLTNELISGKAPES